MRTKCINTGTEEDVVFLLKETSMPCAKIGRIYNCSRGPIWNIQKKHNIIRPRAPHTKHNDVLCKSCKKAFRAIHSRTRPNRGKFCSKVCYTKWQTPDENRGQKTP